MRRIVRRSLSWLGEFMLPFLAMQVAPFACIHPWEFILPKAEPLATIDPSARMIVRQCLGCGELKIRHSPDVDPAEISHICADCRERLRGARG